MLNLEAAPEIRSLGRVTIRAQMKKRTIF